jgi:Uma2 family endonuclease
MRQKEFHRIYEQMPEDFKAELIGGIVYVASPLRLPHATHHTPLGALFFTYETSTPGVESGDNATVILDDDNEPQPDLYLRILPEYGGQSRTTRKGYLAGPPELLAEIAHSSRALDLHAKKDLYAKAGVREYIVICVHERQFRWFDLGSEKEYTPDAHGVIRSVVFPGLWIDSGALLARDGRQLMKTLQQGLETPEHAAFVAALAARHSRPRKGKTARRRRRK